MGFSWDLTGETKRIKFEVFIFIFMDLVEKGLLILLV